MPHTAHLDHDPLDARQFEIALRRLADLELRRPGGFARTIISTAEIKPVMDPDCNSYVVSRRGRRRSGALRMFP